MYLSLSHSTMDVDGESALVRARSSVGLNEVRVDCAMHVIGSGAQTKGGFTVGIYYTQIRDEWYFDLGGRNRTDCEMA